MTTPAAAPHPARLRAARWHAEAIRAEKDLKRRQAKLDALRFLDPELYRLVLDELRKNLL